ncbi:zinc knuckle CX2CX4HX4C containing protein [Tanacetum coccineum]
MNGTVDCDRRNDIVDNSVIDDNGGISVESKRESLNDVIENTENDNVGMKNLESDSYEKNDVKKVNSSKESVDFVNKFEQEKRKSYADVIDEDMGELDKNLMDIPTELDSNGIEIVVFDDVMIAEGSKKWERTLCAYFVGYSMAVSELKYNLRKMWSRYGFKDIVDYNNGVYFMKFNNENGLQNVVNNRPWMVKNKPLIVQKWDINMCLDKTEPETIPLWIKIGSVPLEAWTIKGISQALALVELDILWLCLQCLNNKVNIRPEANKEREDKEVNQSNGNLKNGTEKNDNEGFIPVQNKKQNAMFGKVLRPNFKPNTQQNRGGNQRGNDVNDKGESSGGIREENEVFPDDSGIARCMEEDGLSTSNKQKEVKSFITDENLSICAVLETHIKSRKLNKIHKRIVDKHAWVIMGDMNATLASNEHSAGSSYMNTDMNEFKGCVNRIEVEDIVSSGLFYTWTM